MWILKIQGLPREDKSKIHLTIDKKAFDLVHIENVGPALFHKLRMVNVNTMSCLRWTVL